MQTKGNLNRCAGRSVLCIGPAKVDHNRRAAIREESDSKRGNQRTTHHRRPAIAQHQAFEHGVKFSGCTVHFVDEGLDSGPILCQAVVPVLDDDTAESLSARILKEEHRIYTEAIALVLSGRFRIEGRRVIPAR